jgi:hypothetical protein
MSNTTTVDPTPEVHKSRQIIYFVSLGYILKHLLISRNFHVIIYHIKELFVSPEFLKCLILTVARMKGDTWSGPEIGRIFKLAFVAARPTFLEKGTQKNVKGV